MTQNKTEIICKSELNAMAWRILELNFMSKLWFKTFPLPKETTLLCILTIP